MTSAEHGNTVKIHYTGRLEDGTVFDSSEGREPLEFRIGAGWVIPGFEAGVLGMKVGDKKTQTIPAEEAYGAPRPELVFKVRKDVLPPGLDPAVGDTLQMQQQNGAAMPVVVIGLDDEFVTFDANHPLAGKTLVFDLELVDVA